MQLKRRLSPIGVRTQNRVLMDLGSAHAHNPNPSKSHTRCVLGTAGAVPTLRWTLSRTQSPACRHTVDAATAAATRLWVGLGPLPLTSTTVSDSNKSVKLQIFSMYWGFMWKRLNLSIPRYHLKNLQVYWCVSLNFNIYVFIEVSGGRDCLEHL